jgi:hypothetical protein
MRRFAYSPPTRAALGLLPAALLVLATVGCSTAPIHNVPPTRLGHAPSLEKRAEQIDRAARFEGWTVETLEPGLKIVNKRKGSHVASSTVRFDRERYSITLRDSINLDQSGDRIHKVYNLWVEGLEDAIRNEAAADVNPLTSSPSGD